MELSGKITTITYNNPSSNFAIFKIRTKTGDVHTVRCINMSVEVSTGLNVTLSGSFVEHEKYGRQFAANSCEAGYDDTKPGVVSYIVSNVKGVGNVTASKLFDTFGKDLIQILDDESSKGTPLEFDESFLVYHSGLLTDSQYKSLMEEWSHSRLRRGLVIYLTDLGLNQSQVKTVLTYNNSVEKNAQITRSSIASNPYVLCQLCNMSFQTIDRIALNELNIDNDAHIRVSALLYFAFRDLSMSEGHVFCTSSHLKSHIAKVFKRKNLSSFSHGNYISDSDFSRSLATLEESGILVRVGDSIYEAGQFYNEINAAAKLRRIASNLPFFGDDLDELLEDFEKKNKISLSPEQKQAFLNLKKSNLVVVSGYPGTGKTLVVSLFVHLFENYKIEYNLVSPTGIAAKRLSQVTDRHASTIHRLLGYNGSTWEFNKSNPFSTGAVVVDEMSMVDSSIFNNLISALPDNAILILVGDKEQLPSVMPGDVLGNLMRTPSVQKTSLTKIFRQGKLSDIVRVSHAILNNEPICIDFNHESEVLFINIKDEGEVLSEICKLSSMMKSRGKNFQVMAPVYDGDLGVNNLNVHLREALNPLAKDPTPKIKCGDHEIYVGDRIMITKNDYGINVYNGDVGKVESIDMKTSTVVMKIFNALDDSSGRTRFVDKSITIKFEDFRPIVKLAFATSIHRSQGNEMDYVILPMYKKYGMMLYKNLIYTALTRAKKKAFIIGDPDAFISAAQNERESIRNSNLSRLI